MRLAIDQIRMDGGTQPRAMIDFSVVSDYADAIGRGVKLPPVVVFYDGSDRWLADGFHRVKAAREAGIDSVDADVRQGTRADAVWFSCGANQGHGLRRTNADKRRAVETALRLRPDPAQPDASDRAIAEHCGVSPSTVADVRRDVAPRSVSNLDTDTARGGGKGAGPQRVDREQKREAGKASAAARKASAPDPEPAPAAPRDFLREAMTPPEPAPPPPEPPAQERQPFGLEYRSGLARIREIMAGFLPIERRAAVAAITEDQRVKDIA